MLIDDRLCIYNISINNLRTTFGKINPKTIWPQAFSGGNFD